MPFLKKSKHAPVAAMTIPIINKNFPKSAIKDLIPYTSVINIVEIRRVNQWTIGNIAPAVNQKRQFAADLHSLNKFLIAKQ